MKKLYLLSGIMVFSVASNINASGYVGEMTTAADVYKNIARQEVLERPLVYKELDKIMTGNFGEINWDPIFNFLDAKKGKGKDAINANKYRFMGTTLLGIAINQGQLPAVTKLLETYKVDPNVPTFVSKFRWNTALQLACSLYKFVKQDSLAIITVLLEHGANPYFYDDEGLNSFDWAQQYAPDALKILNKYKK